MSAIEGEGTEYLSDRQGSAYFELERRQLASHEGDRSSSINYSAVISRFPGIEDLLRQVEKASPKKVPTRYESALHPHFTTLYFAPVAEAAALRAGRATVLPKVAWGTVHLNVINATSQRVGDEYLIVLNSFLRTYVQEVFQITSSMFQARNANGYVSFAHRLYSELAQEERRAMSADLATAIYLYANRRDVPLQALERRRPTDFLAFVQIDSVHRFIFGHEFGHILSGLADRRAIGLTGDIEEDVDGLLDFGKGWKAEFIADKIAMQLVDASNGKTNYQALAELSKKYPIVGGAAPSVFLEVTEVLEDYMYCDGSGEGSRSLSNDVVDSLTAKSLAVLGSEDEILISSEEKDALGCRYRGHPPAWLRSRLYRSHRGDLATDRFVVANLRILLREVTRVLIELKKTDVEPKEKERDK